MREYITNPINNPTTSGSYGAFDPIDIKRQLYYNVLY